MSENGIKLAEALVVVDVQRAFISGADAVPDLLSLQRAVGRLLERAREKAVPIIFVQNDGEKGAPDEPGTDGWQLFFDASPVKRSCASPSTMVFTTPIWRRG